MPVLPDLTKNKLPGALSEKRFSENSEYINREMRETLGFRFRM